MSFLIDGKSMNSPECRSLMAKYQSDMVRSSLVDATLTFDVEQGFMDFEDTTHKCRPYLVLLGRPVSVAGEFPCDISQMRYQDAADRSLITYRYDLTRHNLTELAAKGLFDDGFEVPSIVRENQFELPCKINCAVLPPEHENLPPVMFASLEIGSLSCSDETSGYVISSYFESVPEPELASEQEADVTESIYQRTLEESGKTYEAAVTEKPAVDAIEKPSAAIPPAEPVKAPVASPTAVKAPVKHRDASDVAAPQAAGSNQKSDDFLI